MIKNLRVYTLLAVFFTAGAIAFADRPSSSLDDKPSVDSAAVSGVQVPAVPADTTSANSTQTSYLYDLKKLIEKSRENIKDVNEKIKEQAILKRNQKREERSREYYEKGVELTNEGKLDEAREYFEKAIRITDHPEMAGYIRESQRRLRRQESALQAQERQHFHQIKEDEVTRKEDVEAAYKQAVELYKQKKYHPAKDAFDHVDEMAPDYRATDSYLKIIDQDIVLADALAVKAQAVEIARQQKEAEAARAKEKAMWLAQIEEKEKEHKQAIDRQAEEVYNQAIALYKNKKFSEAKKKFEEVSWVIPNYKSTMKYLARIDKDAKEEEERVAQEQQKALQQQRWEEEVERKKQEVERQRALEAKEQKHQKDLEEQAQFIYTAAVNLFDHKNMDAALDKFNEIEKLVPDYKSTRMYLSRISQWKFDQQHQLVGAKVDDLYDSALKNYKAHNWPEANNEFESVERMLPNYKHTRRYLVKLEKYIPAAPATIVPVSTSAPEVHLAPPVPIAAVAAPTAAAVVQTPTAQSSLPAQVKVAVSLEDQQKQVQDIAALAERSAQLYRQVADIADDTATVQTKRKLEQVDDILNSLKAGKERLLRHMREEQWRRQQQESKAKQQEQRAEAERAYQQGLELLRSHEYAKAKIKFLQVENIIPDYKSTHRYLGRVDEDLKHSNSEAVTSYEKTQAQHLSELQNKEDKAVMQRNQQAQDKQHMIEEQQQASLRELAQKAASINDDIIRLSKTQDYEGMKAKFTELENTVTALVTLKAEMAKEKDRQERNKQLARESMRDQNLMVREEKSEDKEIHAYYRVQPLKEYRPILSNQHPAQLEQYKRREIMQEQNMLFSEGVDRYEHKKYTQAKLLFGELAEQNDRRAEMWLRKVDRAITRELLKSQEGEEKERTAFIQDQVKAQRQLIIIQERERLRQKELTEELERQKRLYEDDRLLQLRKEEVLKAQERERQRQEAKRLKHEQEMKKQQEMYRFHKVIPVAQPAAPPVVVTPAAAPKPVVVTPPVVAPAAPAVVAVKPAVPPALTSQQIQAQTNYSNERKAFLDKKYKKEQEEQAREAKRKAAADARQKRIEERQKEVERQKELKAAREQDRQAKLKAEADAREKIKEDKQKELEHQQELKAEEAKHKQEVLQQQAQEREEKIKQEQIMREEAQRRQELERQERAQQAQLEAQRAAVRKQLEDGVESMYQEALSLYKQGDFSAAADKFKDVQDILPDYKRSAQYMDAARQKSLDAHAVIIPQPPSTATPVSRDNSVSKALDLFDSNVK